MSSRLTLAAPAKINLWLRILGRRDDGYHEVNTRMLRLSLADEVTVTLDPAGDAAHLTCSDPSVPTDESNLALKALRAFQRRASYGGGWTLDLKKRIPAGAGMGGGSSNAASVLLAANRLAGEPLDQAALLKIAGGIGADVAFFVLETAAADAAGRGEQVTPVALESDMALLLIKPPFPIPTPWAYSRWRDSEALPGVLAAPQITPWGALVNDLERPVFHKYLLLPGLKMWLLDQPECLAALMSGSGSTVFAIARDGEQAAELQRRAEAFVGEDCFTAVVTGG